MLKWKNAGRKPGYRIPTNDFDTVEVGGSKPPAPTMKNNDLEDFSLSRFLFDWCECIVGVAGIMYESRT
jgi:hypothetical protein